MPPAQKTDSAKPKTLVDEAYLKLKRMILRQNLLSAQRLIAKDLADHLKMSRTPVVNALYQLEREGFIVSAPYKGFYVNPIDAKEAREIFEVREALEVQAVRLCIERLTDESLDTLEEFAKKHAEYMPHYYDRNKVALGSEFHIQLAEITGNNLLVKQLTLNLEHIYLRFSMEGANPGRMQPAVNEHFELIEYMRKRDLEATTDLLRQHIMSNRDHVLKLIEINTEETLL